MKVNPYLNFDGHAEEAFQFYRSVFGGEFTANILGYGTYRRSNTTGASWIK